MKKIISFIVLLAGVISFTSCDNDSTNPYAHESVIQIVKADELTFNSIGGESYIEFTAPANVQITANADWVTLIPETSSRVGVAVTANNNKSDRSAQVTFKSGLDEVIVTVHQLGFVLRIDAPESVTCGNRAATYTIPMSHSGDVTASADVDWITPYVDGDNLCYDVAANEQHVCRRGIVTYRSGAYEGSFEVLQGDVNDLVGKSFILGGLDMTADEDTDPEDMYFMMLATLTSDKKADISIPSYGISGLSTKVKLDASDLSVNFACGGLGKLTKTLYGALCAVDFNAGNLSWDSNVYLKFPVDYFEMEDFTGHAADLASGTFDGEYEINGMMIYLFSDVEYKNALGYMVGMYDCFLEEYAGDPDDEEARSLAIKKAKSNAIARRTLGRR